MTDPLAHGYDFSYAQISGVQVLSGGGSFVVRYLGGNASLTPVERDNLHAAGVAIVLVYETAADEVTHPERGRQDGINAAAQAGGLGYPSECALLFADDNRNTQASTGVAYTAGALQGVDGRYPTGLYSSAVVLGECLYRQTIVYAWGVGTWGNGEQSNGTIPDPNPNCHLIQLANTRNPEIPGLDPETYDTNLMFKPIPAWGPSGVVWLGGTTPTQPKRKKPAMPIVASVDTVPGRAFIVDNVIQAECRGTVSGPYALPQEAHDAIANGALPKQYSRFEFDNLILRTQKAAGGDKVPGADLKS